MLFPYSKYDIIKSDYLNAKLSTIQTSRDNFDNYAKNNSAISTNNMSNTATVNNSSVVSSLNGGFREDPYKFKRCNRVSIVS